MAFGYDPTLAAYLRQMGVSEQNIYAENRQRSDLVQRQYDRSLPAYAEQERAAVEQVQGDAEDRGVYRSGATVRNTALARNAVALRQNEALAAMQDTQLAAQLDAERRLADLRRQAAEQELQARTRQTITGAEALYGSF